MALRQACSQLPHDAIRNGCAPLAKRRVDASEALVGMGALEQHPDQDADQAGNEVIDKELGRHLREMNEKRARCSAARPNFAAAAGAYARTSANVAIHDEQIARSRLRRHAMPRVSERARRDPRAAKTAALSVGIPRDC